MKLFYCPENESYCDFLVIMAENIEECEEKVKSFLDLDVRKRSVPLRICGNYPDDFETQYVSKVVQNILANKEHWEEIESGIFNGEWS